MQNFDKKLMLLDGFSLINRAFYALPPFTTQAGVPTNAVLGFLNIYFKLLDDELPTHCAVAFDLPEPTFRHKMFDGYKATRKPFPPELKAQIPIIKELLEKMNIPIVSLKGYEADDILATLAVQAQAEGFVTTIVTGDRDLLHMATDHIKIRIPKTSKGQTTTEDYFAKDFIEKMGITPTEYIDLKALMGDASDNVPGVTGIGEKTALKIIAEHKDIESAIQAAIDNPKPSKVIQNLRDEADMARLSKKLVTIAYDAEIDVDLSTLIIGEMFTDEVFEEFKRLELRSLLKKFGAKKGGGKKNNTPTLKGNVLAKAPMIDQSQPCAFHFLRAGSSVVGLSLAWGDELAFIPLNDDFGPVADFFESSVQKIGFDAKKDVLMLRQNGIIINNLTFDTLLGGYLLGSLKDGDGLADLSLEYLQEPLVVNAMQDDQLSLLDDDAESADDLSEEGFAKALVILRAHAIIQKRLEEEDMDRLFYEMEMPLLSILADMEHEGVLVDSHFIKEYGAKLDVDINRLTSEIHALAGSDFNINSPKQLAKVLFEDLGLKGGKRTKTGFSTNVDVLQKLAKEHEICEKILEYRSLTKLSSTYVDGLLAAINPKTGRVHTTFNQALTATGRLSSNHPNLQNIPVRTPLGRELRKAFIATDGFVFADADYSQIELRILAELSRDATFLDAFASGADIHKITAARVFQVDFDEVTDEMRSAAKAVNFGIVYGISAFALSEDIGVSVKEAESFIKSYFARYPAVKGFMDNAIEDAREKGYSQTLWGRRRPLPELASANFTTRSFGERAAMNMPVQGSAADIIKIAMIKVHGSLKAKGLKSRLILQIHDELLIETAKDEIEEVKEILRNEMQNAVKMSVPLTIDINFGSNWYESK